MTSEVLNSRSRKILASMARKHGISGWHSMTKPELVRALVRSTRTKSALSPATPSPTRKSVVARSSLAAKPVKSGKKNNKAKTIGRNRISRALSVRDLSRHSPTARKGNARSNFLDAKVVDEHWIRAEWDFTRDSVLRAESKLKSEWHSSVPTLRLLAITVDDVNSVTEHIVKDVAIQAEVNNWYLNVPTASRSYRLQIGYKTSAGAFFALAKSNVCTMPLINPEQPNKSNGADPMSNGEIEVIDADDRSPTQLGRPLGFSTLSHFGPSASESREKGEFDLRLETELIVHGTTRPGSHLTVHGSSVDPRADGSFTVRINQPEGRQVIAFSAVSPNGSERRTVVLCIERNTKELERQYFDGGNSETPTET